MSGNVLSAKQHKAINAILTERTLADAAKAAGVNVRTLNRWMGDRTFIAELKAAEAALLDATVRRLTSISGRAVLVLEWAMTSAGKEGTKVRAADIVLSRLMTLKELHEFDARISALEAGINANKSEGPVK
jgi:hypothetical protein